MAETRGIRRRPAKVGGGVWVAALSSLLLAISLQVILLCPISPSPHPLQLPSPAAAFPLNRRLQEVTKLGHGFLKDPEDICVDAQGILYAATRDGWIKRLHPNGSWENWKNTHSRTLLGIAPSNSDHGGIIVCDADKVQTNAEQLLLLGTAPSSINISSHFILFACRASLR